MIEFETQRTLEALLIRYATAVDRRDAALLASCFTADAKADYGEKMGRWSSCGELVDGLMAIVAAVESTQHCISNIVLEKAADGVKSRCYVQGIVQRKGADAPSRSAGVYDDFLISTSAGWRIQDRVYLPAP